MLWVLLLSLGGIYGGVALLLCLFQSQLMHLPNVPGRELVATPSRIDLPYESVYLMTADGIKLHGWFVLAHQPHMTLLFLHGNAGNISHRLDALAIFHRLRLNTLIIDYRGYGQSAGKASEAGLYRDAEAALRYLREVRSVPLQDIVIFGRSLGGAVAAWLAARQPGGALIIESSFMSAPALAADLYPFLPSRLLTFLRYDTLTHLKAVNSPVLVIHSRDDEIIPFRHGLQLFAAAREPKQFVEIHGSHNEGFLQSRRYYVNAIAEFLTMVKARNPVTVSGSAPTYPAPIELSEAK
jgi:fermentation-respiration switch protein FrsA (DUF1100 family)